MRSINAYFLQVIGNTTNRVLSTRKNSMTIVKFKNKCSHSTKDRERLMHSSNKVKTF